MKNVTISLDDDTHRKARVRAAELGTSLSALVKAYLQNLAEGEAITGGVREMQTSYKPEPNQAEGPPWLVNGERVFTRNGKPRQPGSMRGMWIADDFDSTPGWLIDAMEGEGADQPWPE